EIFKEHYFIHNSPITVSDMHFYRKGDMVEAELAFLQNGRETRLRATGNGSLDAASNALKAYTGASYTLQDYTEHSMQEKGSGSVAAAYIGITNDRGDISWGAGTNTDIIRASVDALLSAFNNIQ
ncbi:MAG: 2-isopropylmalate synthase, partial [Ruminococcaceae bacterium]|nr:2-isopropylmalate synthase [Oscillospiraceae bacterium]